MRDFDIVSESEKCMPAEECVPCEISNYELTTITGSDSLGYHTPPLSR